MVPRTFFDRGEPNVDQADSRPLNNSDIGGMVILEASFTSVGIGWNPLADGLNGALNPRGSHQRLW